MPFTILFLFIFLCAGCPAAAKSFDVEEFVSLDELAAALKERVTETTRGIAGKSLPTADRKVRLALVPMDIGRSDIVPELARLMNAYGRTSVADTAKTAAFVKALEPGRDPVTELGQAFDLDVVAAVRVYPSAGKLLVLVRIFPVEGGRDPETVAAMLPLSPVVGGPGGVSHDAWSVEKADLPGLPFTARYFRAADLDGAREYVFSDGSALSVYRREADGWRSVWAEPRMPKGQEGRHVYLDAADVNGNGRMEIFVTVMSGRAVFSLIFEEEGGAYRQMAAIPGFVRVLSFPRGGPVLLGQGHQEERMFFGEVKQYKWTGSGYVAGGVVELPKGVGLYGFAEADFGETHPLIAALDGENRLCIYSRGELVWRSEERYENVDTVLTESTHDVYDVRRRAAIPGRIMAADMDGDGTEEIIIARITEKTLFGEAGKAEIHCLRWTGARLERVLTVNDVPGAVLDFQVERQNREGLLMEVLVRTQKGVFSKSGARMTTYSLKGSIPGSISPELIPKTAK